MKEACNPPRGDTDDMAGAKRAPLPSELLRVTSIIKSSLARLSSEKLDSPYLGVISASQELNCKIIRLVRPKKLESVEFQRCLSQLGLSPPKKLRSDTLRVWKACNQIANAPQQYRVGCCLCACNTKPKKPTVNLSRTSPKATIESEHTQLRI